MNRALLSSSNRLNSLILKRGISSTQPVLSGWARDFRPGPYPKTEAERLAAAKKYGLLPQDYKPYPDDGLGYGDYPDLGMISTDMRSDYENWDDPYGKRNFGDPYHILAEQITADKTSFKPLFMPIWKIVVYWIMGWGSIIGLYYLTYDYKFGVPIAKKDYPRQAARGEKHFSY